MRLHPNPPRLVTVVLAVALGIVGLAFALPIDAGVNALQPILDPVVTPLGLTLDVQFGYLGLFMSPSLLVVGSLLPGI
jgi:hypothetical protein